MDKVKYNREFQNIDTQDKAYVLGLIYSDGYIEGIKNCHYAHHITLHEKDVYLL